MRGCTMEKLKRIIKITAAPLLVLALFVFVLSRMPDASGWEERITGVISQDAGNAEDAVAYKGKIALTFDDGPHEFYTEQVLDGLKQRGVHATFFIMGQNAQEHPEIVKRMAEEGHLIGNHTYHHVQLTDANAEEFEREIVSTNEVLEQITGTEINYIRPPFGSWDKKYEDELDMFPVLWDIEAVETENMGKYLQQL